MRRLKATRPPATRTNSLDAVLVEISVLRAENARSARVVVAAALEVVAGVGPRLLNPPKQSRQRMQKAVRIGTEAGAAAEGAEDAAQRKGQATQKLPTGLSPSAAGVVALVVAGVGAGTTARLGRSPTLQRLGAGVAAKGAMMADSAQARQTQLRDKEDPILSLTRCCAQNPTTTIKTIKNYQKSYPRKAKQ
jgi:hypothetical protein